MPGSLTHGYPSRLLKWSSHKSTSNIRFYVFNAFKTSVVITHYTHWKILPHHSYPSFTSLAFQYSSWIVFKILIMVFRCVHDIAPTYRSRTSTTPYSNSTTTFIRCSSSSSPTLLTTHGVIVHSLCQAHHSGMHYHLHWGRRLHIPHLNMNYKHFCFHNFSIVCANYCTYCNIPYLYLHVLQVKSRRGPIRARSVTVWQTWRVINVRYYYYHYHHHHHYYYHYHFVSVVVLTANFLMWVLV